MMRLANNTGCIRFTALALAACAVAGSVAAQPTLRDNPAAPPELTRPPFLPSGQPEGLQTPPSGAGAATRGAPSPKGEVLRTLAIHGNTAISTETLMDVARPWLGQSANAADLEALRIALTRHYVDQGYVNSGARLDPAGLRDGVLAIEIVEGRLSQLRFSGLDGLDEQYVRARLWPDAERPLNLEELRERYQLLLDDPLIRRMNARVLPAQGTGTAALDVAVERAQPWWFAARLNNHRPASVGERSLGFEAGYRNLTGRGDVLRLHAHPDIDLGGFDRLGVAWTVPLVYPGTLLTLQLEDSDSTVVEEPLASADVKNRLASREVTLSHTFVETLRHRAVAGVTWLDRRNTNWIGGQRFPFLPGVPDEGLRARSLRLWQEYVYRSQETVLAARSTFVETRNNVQALPPELGIDVTPSRGRFWLGQAQLAQRLGDAGWQAVARLTVQEAQGRLLSLDGLSIGGASTVRGWRENQLIRDRGAILNLELEVPVSLPGLRGASLHAVPFVDYGRGRNVGQQHDAIGSVGLALRWRAGPWWAEAAWGHRAASTISRDRSGGSWQDHGLHVQVAYVFGR